MSCSRLSRYAVSVKSNVFISIVLCGTLNLSLPYLFNRACGELERPENNLPTRPSEEALAARSSLPSWQSPHAPSLQPTHHVDLVRLISPHLTSHDPHADSLKIAAQADAAARAYKLALDEAKTHYAAYLRFRNVEMAKEFQKDLQKASAHALEVRALVDSYGVDALQLPGPVIAIMYQAAGGDFSDDVVVHMQEAAMWTLQIMFPENATLREQLLGRFMDHVQPLGWAAAGNYYLKIADTLHAQHRWIDPETVENVLDNFQRFRAHLGSKGATTKHFSNDYGVVLVETILISTVESPHQQIALFIHEIMHPILFLLSADYAKRGGEFTGHPIDWSATAMQMLLYARSENYSSGHSLASPDPLPSLFTSWRYLTDAFEVGVAAADHEVETLALYITDQAESILRRVFAGNANLHALIERQKNYVIGAILGGLSYGLAGRLNPSALEEQRYKLAGAYGRSLALGGLHATLDAAVRRAHYAIFQSA